MKKAQHPTVAFTSEALVIRIPWNTVHMQPDARGPKARKLTTRDVPEIVDAGRLAHALGMTRSVGSLDDGLPVPSGEVVSTEIEVTA